MCDDLTAREEERALAAKSLSRREFATIGAAGVLAACTGGDSEAKGRALSESTVAIPTPDGSADGFFVHPAQGKHPGVILWPDVAGLRDAYKVMARQLAGAGYAVLVVNQYYRGAKAPILSAMSEWRTPEGQAKLKPMMATISAAGVVSDAKACVAWLDTQKAVNKRRGIGSQGYCMGGPFAVRTAFAAPDRVKAAASFHGGGLVTPAADSPHRLLGASKASYLIAVARNDDARAPGDKDAFKDAAKAAGRSAEVEVYAADHGWCTLDSPVYDKAEAERAWGRLLALYKGL